MSESKKYKKYKLLISGTLVQKTAFSTGGNRHESDDNSDIDNLLAKDGKDRYTLRGASLAGAFLATAKQLVDSKEDELKGITEDTPAEQQKILKDKFEAAKAKEKDKKLIYKDWLQEQPRMNESLWIFHHAHPTFTDIEPEVRDNVAIHQQTGAAKDGAKFDAEILPVGTRWDFLMEVDEYRDDDTNKASAIALHVAKQWQQCCWLGRDVARGLGWMKLENLKVYRLTTEQISQWPDSSKPPHELLQGLSKTLLSDEQINAIKAPITLKQDNDKKITGTITLEVGQNNDGYGLDMLSVGGHQKKRDGKERNTNQPHQLMGKAFLKDHKSQLLAPQGIELDEYIKFKHSKEKKKDRDADFSLSVTKQANDDSIPIIPGSSIRGSLRHVLSWLLRKRGAPIWNPADTKDTPNENDIVNQLFGSTKESAKLLISDAMPADNDWQMVVLEMHAEDEFTQGVFGGGKFDRTCLTKGKFKADFYLENSTEDAKEALKTLKTLGENQLIPIGGGQWKGLGWIKLSFACEEQACEEQ